MQSYDVNHEHGKPQATVIEGSVDRGGTRFCTSLPGLTAHCFNRYGKVSVWNSAKLLESARVSAVLNPLYFTKDLATGGRTFFIVLMNYKFSPRYYQKVHSYNVKFPLGLTNELASFGNTSIDFISKLTDEQTGSSLVELKFKYASVDTHTRKSAPLPQEIREHLQEFTQPKYSTTRYTPKIKPESGVFSLTFSTLPSDIDFNLHLNNSAYIRMASDVASLACIQGKLPGFNGDFSLYRPQEMQVLYLVETRLGEELVISVWPDEQMLKLNFVIEKNNKASFHLAVEYYPQTKSNI